MLRLGLGIRRPLNCRYSLRCSSSDSSSMNLYVEPHINSKSGSHFHQVWLSNQWGSHRVAPISLFHPARPGCRVSPTHTHTLPALHVFLPGVLFLREGVVQRFCVCDTGDVQFTIFFRENARDFDLTVKLFLFRKP